MRIGVDTGGTFTDLVAVGESGELFRAKIPSTPDDPARALLAAVNRTLDALRDSDRPDPEVLREVAHGSTVATNALLERRGARVVLLTTEGFEDVLAIGRQTRPALHHLEPELSPPLVPSERRLGIPERLGPRGEVIRPLELDEAAAAALRARLTDLGAEAVAIVLLHAYASGEHEELVAGALAELGLPLTVSHHLVPEHREYERSSTCVANAFVATTCQRYLGRIEEQLAPARLTVLRSDGGVRSGPSAREAPIHTALSGPAGGVTGAVGVAEQAGLSRVLTLDMGGTSTDVCVVVEGHPLRRDQVEVGELPLRIPALDIHTVGAGGGSLAWRDAGGALRVGPRSAGADPGPAAYGRGGTLPTLTDAHLVLGRIPGDLLLGGELPLDAAAAREAVAGLAIELGLGLEACAEGIVRVAGAVMARALRRVSLERGHDPRDFVLMPFGGAGGLHAAELAELLEIPEVVVPRAPGLLCARGALAARRRDSRRQSLHLLLDPAAPDPALGVRLESSYAQLATLAREALRSEGEAEEDLELERLGELRYRGQSATLEIALAPGDAAHPQAALAAFERAHAEAFGFTLPRPVEWVVARVEARGAAPTLPPTRAPEVPARKLEGGPGTTVERETLGAGSRLRGPVSIVEQTGTTWVPAGWEARVDQAGLLRLSAGGPRQRRPTVSAPAPITDPVELTVWRHLFAALTEEMGAVLGRAAFSPNIKERRDFSCALFEPGGEMVAHAAHIPVHLGATPLSVASVREALELGPGDLAILNDPFAGGTHLPDLTSVEAVFDDRGETLLGLVAVRAHHADVGGERPGSMPLTDHIDAEGVRLPPTLVQRGGLLDEAAVEAFASHSRDPQERRGDLAAQLAASRAGAARLRALAASAGEREVGAAMRGLVEHAGRSMRATLGALPDGVFTAEDFLDDDGRGHGPLPLRLTLTLRGEEACFDFRDCAPACEGPLNAVRAIVVSATLYALRLLADDEVPDSSGLLEPVEILTREGSLLDARHPSPVAGGNVETSQRLVDLILAALAEALPGELPAQSQGTMNNVLMGGARPTPWAYYETLGGGIGAGPARPGASGTHSHMTNTRNTPVEVVEHTTPLRVLRYGLRPGSGGAGRHPGGEGLVRSWEALEPTEVTLLAERRLRAPAGAAGGGAGAPGAQRVVRADGGVEALPGKCELRLEPGDRLEIETPGGGGHGDPGPGDDGP